MNIFDANNFCIFDRAVKRIYDEYNVILSIFNNDVHDYIDKTASPFDITVPLTDVVKFVDSNYVDMCGQVEKVFDSTHHLSVVSDNFVRYYELLKESVNNTDNSPEGKTMKIALVLILASISLNNFPTNKIQVVLRSMCNMPTVGVLVHVSNTVLGDPLD